MWKKHGKVLLPEIYKIYEYFKLAVFLKTRRQLWQNIFPSQFQES